MAYKISAKVFVINFFPHTHPRLKPGAIHLLFKNMQQSHILIFARFVVRPLFIYNSSFLIKQSNLLQPIILKIAYTET